MKRSKISSFTRHLLAQPKVVMACILVLSLGLYLLGFEWLLIIVSLISVAVFIPVPKIINSWFGRVIVGILYLFSLLQLATALEFVLFPKGRFELLAIVFVGLLLVLLFRFGKLPKQKLGIFSKRDLWVAIACLIFVMPFVAILARSNPSFQIARLGGLQIIDSTVHYDGIAGDMEIQGLSYTTSNYYPRGFHVAGAFIQDSFWGDLQSHHWKTRAVLYMSHYLFLGLILVYILIYAGNSVFASLGYTKQGSVIDFSIAITIGLAATLLHLFLFMHEGFLNYYFISALIFGATLYLLDNETLIGFKTATSTKLADKWPLVAYLILTLGVAYSWPLFIPPILVVGGLFVLPQTISEIKKFTQIFNRANLWLVVLVAFQLLALFFQTHYMKASGSALNLGGAVHTFNPLLIGLGVIVMFLMLVSNKFKPEARQRLLLVIFPYVLMILGLMALQFFVLGEARYYLIKSAMVLEMFLLVFVVAYVAALLENAKLDALVKCVCLPTFVLFAVIGTIATLPKPLQEVRELFRFANEVGIGDEYQSDTYKIAKLGDEGKLAHFNLGVLHYEEGGRGYYANVQAAQWANTIARSGIEPDICFSNLYVQLTYIQDSPDQQEKIRNFTHKCIELAAQNNIPYFIVTDQKSVPQLQKDFGEKAQLVY